MSHSIADENYGFDSGSDELFEFVDNTYFEMQSLSKETIHVSPYDIADAILDTLTNMNSQGPITRDDIFPFIETIVDQL